MRLTRNTIWLIPLAIIVTYPLWSIPVGHFLTPRGGFDADNGQESQSPHNFKMNKVKILQNQNGVKTAVILSDQARTDENPDILIMDEVNADIYDEAGNITNIVADVGRYDMTTNTLILTKNVVVHKIVENQLLFTELLIYNNVERTVNCPGPTRLEGENVQIDGGSLDYDIKTQSYVIANRVHCILDDFVKP